MIEISEVTEVMDHLQGLSAVIFDLDDTLYPEKDYVRSGYHEAAKLLLQIPDAEERLWRAFEAGENAFDKVLMDAGIFSPELKDRCLQAYRSNPSPDIHLYSGVREMLQSLRNQGLKTGIITDGRSEGQRAKLNVLGLPNLVDHIIITDELGGPEFRKPCPKAFELMQEKLAVPFEQMAYVGDNPAKDFKAPEQLGMRSVWFRNEGGLYNQE